MATNSVTAVELVLGDGTQLRADADTTRTCSGRSAAAAATSASSPRWSSGSIDIETAYAGMLMWDQEHAERVLRAWAAWTEDAPDCVTTSFRMLNLPPLPELPGVPARPPARGDRRRGARRRRAGRGDPRRPARARARDGHLRPGARRRRWCGCTWTPRARRPAVSASTILADLPGRGDRDVPGADRPRLGLDAAGRRAAPARRCAGPAGRGRGRAADARRARSCSSAVAVATTPEMAAQGHADADALVDAMAPYSSGRDYLNFAEPRSTCAGRSRRRPGSGSRASARRSTRTAGCWPTTRCRGSTRTGCRRR